MESKLSKAQKEILIAMYRITKKYGDIVNINGLRRHMFVKFYGTLKSPYIELSKSNYETLSAAYDSKLLNVTPTFRMSFSRSLKRLENRGLIVREKLGNNNKAKGVSLTLNGLTLLRNRSFKNG